MRYPRSICFRLLAVIAFAWPLGPTRAAALDSPGNVGHRQARQGQLELESAADEASFQRAFAKAFGGEVTINNPVDVPANGDTASDDQFGYAIALSGDTILVGAPGADTLTGTGAGAAYVFARDGTAWSLQATLTADDGAAFDQFGISVALSGNTALVGANQDDTTLGTFAGSAYVFTRSGTVWSQQTKLAAGDGTADDQFGVSVALSGETALVGASLHDTLAGADAGAAYVFTRSGTVWNEQTELTSDDGATDDLFGFSVALSGNTALVGAEQHDAQTGTDAGAAYVFTRSGIAWSQETQLTASESVANDFFGISVALSGDTALVGADARDTTAGADAGAAFVFTRSGTVWSQQAELTAGDGAASDFFGNSVALSGDTALVGAHLDDILLNADAGSAYAFVRSGAVWTQQPPLAAGDGAMSDEFGWSVAVSTDSALVGAPFDDGPVTANPDVGSVHVFTDTGLDVIFEDGFE